MKLIIHGSDIEKTRDYYFGKKNEYPEHLILNGEGLIYDTLFQLSKNKSIFSDEKVIFIENLFTKNKVTSAEFKQIIDFFNVTNDLNVVLWEGSELSKPAISKLNNFEVINFNVPQKLFTFLDQLRPGNSKQLIGIFHELRAKQEDELIFFMLVRQFRLYLQSLGDYHNQIDETKRMAPWQLSKLRSQVKNFNKEQLIHFYGQLFDIELKSKTGKTSVPLHISIDFFLSGL